MNHADMDAMMLIFAPLATDDETSIIHVFTFASLYVVEELTDDEEPEIAAHLHD